MREYQYRIRAHHGMCLAFFKGKGYSNEFTKHMKEVKDRLKTNPLVCIIDETDLICSACPNDENGICGAEEKVAKYDKQVFSCCNIEAGAVMSFSDFEKLVYDNILRPGKREEICRDCEWNSLCHFCKLV